MKPVNIKFVPQTHDLTERGEKSQKNIYKYFKTQFKKNPNKVHIIFTESGFSDVGEKNINKFIQSVDSREDFLKTKAVCKYIRYYGLEDTHSQCRKYDSLKNTYLYIQPVIKYAHDYYPRMLVLFVQVPTKKDNERIKRSMININKTFSKLFPNIPKSEIDNIILKLEGQYYYYLQHKKPNDDDTKFKEYIQKNVFNEYGYEITNDVYEKMFKSLLKYNLTRDTREWIVNKNIMNYIHNMKTKVNKHCNFDIDKHIEYYLVFGKSHVFEQYNNEHIRYKRQLNDPPANKFNPNYKNRIRPSIFRDLK